MINLIGKNNIVLADAHVHIYDCFDLVLFLDSAFSNFKNAAAHLGPSAGYTSILFLTEGRNECWFDRLLKLADAGEAIGKDPSIRYKISRTDEPFSLSVGRDGLPSLFVIAGHQIVTKEKLEILALVSVSDIPDGCSLNTTAESIVESGGVPVVPWGFGKWMGKRGNILNAFLERGSGFPIFLGDNSGRPSFLPHPPQFHLGKGNGIRILPGSDPLPFPAECRKPGSFGFAISGSVDPDKPGEEIRRILLDPRTRPISYGQLETMPRFLRNQLLMQLLKLKNRNNRNTA
jgi:hypothetical protein